MNTLFKGKIATLWAVFFVLLLSSIAYALPDLQLGPDGSGWTYDEVSQTWVHPGSPLSLAAYATEKAFTNKNNTDSTRYAYLVVSAVPKVPDDGFDYFDVTVNGSSNPYTSGWGTPPVEDPNSLAPHGIFDTYFEIYEFRFTGDLEEIPDTQPGENGTGMGYKEILDITFALNDGISGIHFDLFTVGGYGELDLGTTNKKTVKSFAPFSHDAATHVPEPSSTLLLGVGLVALGIGARRKITNRNSV